jgi:hypothetical protein
MPTFRPSAFGFLAFRSGRNALFQAVRLAMGDASDILQPLPDVVRAEDLGHLRGAFGLVVPCRRRAVRSLGRRSSATLSNCPKDFPDWQAADSVGFCFCPGIVVIRTRVVRILSVVEGKSLERLSHVDLERLVLAGGVRSIRTRSEEPDLPVHNLGPIALARVILRLVLAGGQPSFDVNLAALAELS